jgi:hypothetical protein
VEVKNVKPGLKYSMYKGSWHRLPDFSELPVQKEGITTSVAYPKEVPANDIGLVFSGFINIEKAGMYTFTLASDDGSKLIIGDDVVVLNDGRHGIEEAEGAIFLHDGYYPLTVEFFQAGGGSGLQLFIQGADTDRITIPDKLLWHEE